MSLWTWAEKWMLGETQLSQRGLSISLCAVWMINTGTQGKSLSPDCKVSSHTTLACRKCCDTLYSCENSGKIGKGFLKPFTGLILLCWEAAWLLLQRSGIYTWCPKLRSQKRCSPSAPNLTSTSSPFFKCNQIGDWDTGASSLPVSHGRSQDHFQGLS